MRDPNTGVVRHTLSGHKGAINSLAFTPDNKTLITGGLDNAIKFWDASSGKNTLTIPLPDGVLSVTVSRDGKTLASGCRDKTAKVWDLPAGKLRHTLAGHTNSVEGVAISPDGKTIATTSLDNTVKLWDADTGKQLRTLSGHAGAVNAAVFLHGGEKLLTCFERSHSPPVGRRHGQLGNDH